MLRRFYSLTLTVCALLACLLSPAQNPPADSSSNAPRTDLLERPEFHQRNPRYILRTSDSFDVSFTFSPEFNQTVVVEPDGYVTLRGAGSVHVAGQTLP